MKASAASDLGEHLEALEGLFTTDALLGACELLVDRLTCFERTRAEAASVALGLLETHGCKHTEASRALLARGTSARSIEGHVLATRFLWQPLGALAQRLLRGFGLRHGCDIQPDIFEVG